MDHFYGTKKIAAKPMTRADYNEYRGWELPADENGADEGYLVEYLDGGEGNHPDHVGYLSWSPKAQFDAAYQPVTAMSFGHAIEAMKAGHKVARAGWNGKGMWVALTPASEFNHSFAKEGHAAKHRSDEMTGLNDQIHLLPHFDMRMADGSMNVGWLASQPDMLSEDWYIA